MFSGQISSIYGFAEALSSRNRLPECLPWVRRTRAACPRPKDRTLPAGQSAAHSSIMFTYNPVACDAVAWSRVPKSAASLFKPSVFVHSGHALMTGEARSVCTHSIFSTLHSLGGVQIFLPLFGQLGDAGSEANGGGQEVTAPT
uniref:DUF4704 domain-containing protein n=1 Tax=Macrostomum lignano TaxID=282301 RepID=A0A1I8FQ43_9PLAT